MAKRKVHPKGCGLELLKNRLRWKEQGYGALVEISTGKATEEEGPTDTDVTIGLHNWEAVNDDSLQLFLDPDHDLEPPENTELVLRGEAYVDDEAKKVAVFRTNP